MKKIKVQHIVLIIALLLIASFIFAFVNSFTGNPVSAAIASGKIREYAAATYPALNLELSEVKYNFKNNAYGCTAQSKTSEDTVFTISFRGGKVTDDYAYEVANHFTTYRRLSKEFNDLVTPIIEKEYPHKTTLIIGDLAGDTQPLTPDKPLNLKELPLPLSLTVYVEDDVRDQAQMAALLLELHKLMQSKDIPIDQYSLRLEEPLPENEKPGSGDNLYLTDFPASKITDDLPSLAAAIKTHQAAIESADNK